MTIQLKWLGQVAYEETWQAMQTFTDQRDNTTPDELWIVEHPPVFTQGLNGDERHAAQLNQFNQSDIPMVQTDRGGQITYHAPGQLVIYVLLDLKRAKLGVRELVHLMENAIIDFLQQHNIQAEARADAPGVYVAGQKIASLGLKVRKHRSYHGLALNVDMDLTPFQWITPCGLDGIQMTQLADLATEKPKMKTCQQQLCDTLLKQLRNR